MTAEAARLLMLKEMRRLRDVVIHCLEGLWNANVGGEMLLQSVQGVRAMIENFEVREDAGVGCAMMGQQRAGPAARPRPRRRRTWAPSGTSSPPSAPAATAPRPRARPGRPRHVGPVGEAGVAAPVLLLQRGKIVRADFIQGIEEGGHFINKEVVRPTTKMQVQHLLQEVHLL